MQSIKYSNLKIFWHPEKIKDILEKKVSAPVYIRIKPTNVCNHSCFYCSYQNDKRLITTETLNPKDFIPREKMMELLDDLKDMRVKAVTYSGGGEPLVYPYIEEALAKTLDNNIDLSIITNGQNLSGPRAELLAKAKWVRLSLDASDSKTFKQIRNVPEKSFLLIAENIKQFTKIKNPDCELGINFVINHLNWESVYKSAEFYRDLGVNHIKFTARNTPDFHTYHEPFKEQVISQIKKADAEFSNESFVLHNSYEEDFKYAGVYHRSYKFCPIIQIVTVIGADSVVYLCHDKTYSKSGIIGSIKEKSFKDLWFSKETRDRLINFNAESECTHHCTYDLRNILISEILKCAENNVNFI